MEKGRRVAVKPSGAFFVALVIVTVVVLTSLPYILCYKTEPPHLKFTGVLFVRWDTDSYYAWMNQARQGHWLFANKYQTTLHRGAYFNALWFALGRLSAALHISLAAALQICRILSGMALLIVFYRLSHYWLAHSAVRKIALLFFAFGGGFGWLVAGIATAYHLPISTLEDNLQVLLFNLSHDLWAGFHPFFQIFLVPHFAFAHALFLIALYLFLRGEQTMRASFHVSAGFSALVLGLSRPYDALTFLATIGSYTVVSMLRRRTVYWNELRRMAPALVLPLPSLIYYVWLFKFHSLFKLWGRSAQSIAPTLFVIVGLGLAGFLAIYQLGNMLRQSKTLSESDVFLLCWLGSITLLFCSYPLLKFSGQFGLVLISPVVLLAAKAIDDYYTKHIAGLTLPTRKVKFYALMALLVLFNSLTSPILLYQRTKSASEYYIDERILRAFDWLDRYTQPDDAVLASEEMGLKIPIYTKNYVFLGHPHLCENYECQSEELVKFFNPEEDDAFRRGLLRRYHIKYLFYSPYEQDLGPLEPGSLSFLKKVYSNTMAEIYQVEEDL